MLINICQAVPLLIAILTIGMQITVLLLCCSVTCYDVLFVWHIYILKLRDHAVSQTLQKSNIVTRG